MRDLRRSIRAAWRPSSSTSTRASASSVDHGRACDAGLDTLRMLADETDGRAIVNRNDLGEGPEADGQRLQRLLPARLHLAVADRRQVPPDQGPREAAGPAGARAQGLLGADARRRRRRHRRGDAGRPGAGDRRGAGDIETPPRARPSAPGSAPPAARTARPRSRWCGSRRRSRRASAASRRAARRDGRRADRHGLLPRQGARRGRAGAARPAPAAGRAAAVAPRRGRRRAASPSRRRRGRCSCACRSRAPRARSSTPTSATSSCPTTPRPSRCCRCRRSSGRARSATSTCSPRDANPRPTTAREFSRTERLHVRFQAYAPGGGAATPTARLLNRGGHRDDRRPGAGRRGPGPADFEADIPLANLPAGDYLLEVALPGEQAPTKQLVAFRVTS